MRGSVAVVECRRAAAKIASRVWLSLPAALDRRKSQKPNPLVWYLVLADAVRAEAVGEIADPRKDGDRML